MSLLTAKGTFAFPDSANNLPVTGVGFQPKVVLFWMTEQSVTGYLANKALSVGWAVSSSQRGYVSLYAADADTTGQADGYGYNSDLCLRAVSTAANSTTTILSADFVSMDSDGFTIDPIVVSPGKLYVVHWFALGGVDLTNVFAGNFTIPTTASSVGHTGVGFQPDCMLFLAPLNGTVFGDYGGHKVSLGAASSASDQAVAYIHAQSTLPTNPASIQKTGEVINTWNFAGTQNTVAALTSFDSDGFTLNYSTVPGTARPFVALALKGGSYKVVTDTQKTSTGTKAKTGIGFQPTGLLLFGTDRASSASLDSTLASLSIGASDGAAEGASWVGSADNVSTTDENSATLTNKVIRHATGPSTTNAEASVSSFDSDGYTLNWSTADGTAREFIAVAFGDAPASPGGSVHNMLLLGVG